MKDEANNFYSISITVLCTAVFPTKVYADSNFKEVENENDTTDLILPYQVRIEALDRGNNIILECFGTLISKIHVLTVRKCVDRLSNFNVYVRYNTTIEKVSMLLIWLKKLNCFIQHI